MSVSFEEYKAMDRDSRLREALSIALAVAAVADEVVEPADDTRVARVTRGYRYSVRRNEKWYRARSNRLDRLKPRARMTAPS